MPTTARFSIATSQQPGAVTPNHRVVLADDHALLRDGLRSLMGSLDFAHLEVVGEAADVAEAARVTRAEKPDLLVLDLKMPGGKAVLLIRELMQEQPSLHILVLTMYDDAAFVRSVLAAGAHGYLLKRSAYAEFAEALRAVIAGQVYVDASLRAQMAARPGDTSRGGPELLTVREREVLVMLARGLTYAEAGKRLHIGVRTVETHRRNIFEKLSLETRADLLRFALEFGLVGAGDVDEA